jgi:hypothetical protein
MTESYEHDVQMLEEFVSDSQAGTGFIPGPRTGASDTHRRFDPSEAVSNERFAELTMATTSELQVLLHRRAAELRVDELGIIHDLVAKRTPMTCDEVGVMRAAMREVVKRLKK